MKVLVICRPLPGTSPNAMAPYLAAEATELRKLQASGVLLEAFSPGKPGAVLIFEVVDLPEATRIAEDLPLHNARLISQEIIELHPLGL
jgi:hypothetical protein